MKHKSIIVAEGFPFIVLSLVFTGFAAFFGVAWLTILLAALTIFIIAFFRNPQRHFQAAEKLELVAQAVSTASTQLSAQIEQSSRGADEQSGRVRETATAMEQMNATVREVASNAGHASDMSGNARTQAQEGESIVTKVVHGIDEAELSVPCLPGDGRRMLLHAERGQHARISCMVVGGDP